MQFAMNGFAVTLLDFTGFGISGGIRAGPITLKDHHKDIGLALQELNQDLPTFIFGHSMGGMNVTTFLLNNPGLNLAGALICAPMFDQLQQNLPDWKRLAAPMIKPLLSDVVIQGKVPIQYIANKHQYCY